MESFPKAPSPISRKRCPGQPARWSHDRTTVRRALAAPGGSGKEGRSSPEGNSGIGRAVALADVLISSLDEEENAAATRRLDEEAGREAVLVPSTIGEAAHCRRIVEKAVEPFGRVDVLVDNAAHPATFSEPEEISDPERDETFRVTIHATTEGAIQSDTGDLAQMRAETGIRVNCAGSGPARDGERNRSGKNPRLRLSAYHRLQGSPPNA